MKSFVAYHDIRPDPHALTFGQLQFPVIQISSSHSANSGNRRAVTTSSLLVDSLSKPCATIRRSRCKEIVKFDWLVIYIQKHTEDALCILWQCIFVRQPSGIANATCQCLANASIYGAYKDKCNRTRHGNQ